MTDKTCGTYASYSAGCRCRRCRDANNAYHREYYRKVIAARRRDAERKVMERWDVYEVRKPF